MFTTISVLLVLFIILATFDGFYFHLIKYKLYSIPTARREHFIHTVCAFTFIPLSLLLFVFNTSGLLLWTGIVFAIFNAYLELIDILEERKSRASLGGISSEESAIHVFASSLKFSAVFLLLATKSPDSYSSLSPWLLEQPHPLPLVTIGAAFSIGSFIGGVYSMLVGLKVNTSS